MNTPVVNCCKNYSLTCALSHTLTPLPLLAVFFEKPQLVMLTCTDSSNQHQYLPGPYPRCLLVSRRLTKGDTHVLLLLHMCTSSCTLQHHYDSATAAAAAAAAAAHVHQRMQ
jgi:hypothetical protein